MNKNNQDQFSEKEVAARFEAALKGAMNTPHKPLKEKPKSTPHKSGKAPLPKPQKRPNKDSNK